MKHPVEFLDYKLVPWLVMLLGLLGFCISAFLVIDFDCNGCLEGVQKITWDSQYAFIFAIYLALGVFGVSIFLAGLWFAVKKTKWICR